MLSEVAGEGGAEAGRFDLRSGGPGSAGFLRPLRDEAVDDILH